MVWEVVQAYRTAVIMFVGRNGECTFAGARKKVISLVSGVVVLLQETVQ